MKHVLALQHVWDDPPAYLEEILREHEIACDIREVEKEALPDPTRYQAILLMGGPQHVYADEDLPYVAQEKTMLRQAVAEDIPTLGICLGGQLLASALGAEVRQHHLSEVGFFQIPLTEAGRQDPLFAGLPGQQLAFHWHSDVFELPAGAIRLASNENAPNQAFRYARRAYGLQFHIELNDELVHTWLHDPAFAQEISLTLGDENAPMRLEQEWLAYAATYRAHTRTMFENFLRIAELL
jgi:GMP synthase-like glutamine amidotransferase